MGAVSIDKVVPGSVLGSDVRDPLGRLLVAAGTALTERHAKIFQKWGIATVDLREETEAAQRQISPEDMHEARAILEDRFRHVDLNHPFTGELFLHCVERQARKLNAEAVRG